MPDLAAVVLDFDGVILDSVDIKTRAFADLFASEGAEAVARVVEYHERNGGISRFEKFRWLYREVLKRPLPPEEEARLGQRFNELVEEAVSRCAFIPGALDFLKEGGWPFYVASGTPEHELRRIVERRGLAGYFHGVYGAPEKKASILRRVAAQRGGPLAMVGDAINDYDAAVEVGARFVGVRGKFPAGVPVIDDLTQLRKALCS